LDNLRLILILLGLIILAAIVLFHRPAGESRRNHARWLASRREPRISDADADGFDSDEADPPRSRREPIVASRDERPASTANLAAGLASARISTDEDDSHDDDRAVAPSRGAREAPPEKIVTLYVQRKEGRRISGTELHDAAGKAGLDFGEMNIFHRLQEVASQPVFSMANLTAPGYFNPDGWSGFDTPGMTFFLTLPAPVSALDAWDAMLATARRMAELLDAEVLDDNRCLVTRQRIAQVRDEMREYDRRHGIGKSG
jgi:cell division protein ZipA